ncbi:hypothetical protein TNCV_3534381 [Trichonephila clavipes]|nr:hypothetical protein TNCV_3534381 [Trichonephila clavipes]
MTFRHKFPGEQTYFQIDFAGFCTQITNPESVHGHVCSTQITVLTDTTFERAQTVCMATIIEVSLEHYRIEMLGDSGSLNDKTGYKSGPPSNPNFAYNIMVDITRFETPG